jgi:uncharacterized membrane protein
MKKSTPNLLIAIVLLAIPFGYAAYLYPSLPETIPTHFNIKGEADGFGGKDSIFLGPGILGGVGLFTFFLLSNIKNFDPKRYKTEDEGMFKKLALFMVGFLSVLAMIIIYSATGGNTKSADENLNITKILLPFIGLAFSLMGWFMPKLHQNYFAGFKLPWTLENVDNWNETHKVAGKVWLYGGIAQAISTLILPNAAGIIIFLGLVLIMVIIPTVFSYRMFKNGNQIKV